MLRAALTRPSDVVAVRFATRFVLRVALILLASGAGALVILVSTTAPVSASGTLPALTDGAHVDVIPFAADVSPASAQYVSRALGTAQSDGATLVVIELDTFGGDLASMEAIHERELGSRVPIVVFIGPNGAHADSAGAFIALGAPLVAMAAGTRIGSASPVTSAGGDLSATEKAKTENALVAQLTDDQTAFGRNVALATSMVTNASAFDDQTAIADDIVNLGATDLADCLRQVDGQSVRLVNGDTVTLRTSGEPVVTLQPDVRDQLFALFVDPNVLFLLFVLAAICIYLELAHPGAIVPGVVGALALLLFLFGAGSLSPNWAGLALMLLAVVLLAVDVRVPAHGILSVGALISLVVGAIIFFDTGPADQAVNPALIVGVAAGVGLVAALILRYALAARRGKVTTGLQGLIGQEAIITQPCAPIGRVRVLGEDWSASLVSGDSGRDSSAVDQATSQPTAVGERVRVVGADGLRLIIRRE